MYAIFGNGQLAQHLAFAMDKYFVKNEIVGRRAPTDVFRYRNTDIDFDASLASSKQVQDIAKNYDLIIYTSSLRDIAACEKDPVMADRVNWLVPTALASYTKVVYISTDYVFGKLSMDYPRPITGKIGEGEDPSSKYFSGGAPSIYGRTKLSGERGVLNNGGSVVRISSPFGKWKSPLRPSFVDMVVSNMTHLFLPIDQIVSPTYLPEAAEVLANKEILDSLEGVNHLVNEGSGSFFDIGNWARSSARNKSRTSLRYSDDKTDKLRPTYSALQNNKLPKLSHWAEAVSEYLKGTGNE